MAAPRRIGVPECPIPVDITSTSAEVDQAALLARRQQLYIEYLQTMETAMATLQPTFDKFTPTILARLKNFLTFLFSNKSGNEKIVKMRQLETCQVIITGLCMIQKKAETMRMELFHVYLENIPRLAARMFNFITTSEDIKRVVEESGATVEFKEKFRGLCEWATWNTHYPIHYALGATQVFNLTKMAIPAQHNIFQRLVDMSQQHMIQALLPSAEKDQEEDRVLRAVVGFSSVLLDELFGFYIGGQNLTISAGEFQLPAALKDGIEKALGLDVLEAVTSSRAWEAEADTSGDLEKTTCIKATVYPGLMIVLTLTVGWKYGTMFVNATYLH